MKKMMCLLLALLLAGAYTAAFADEETSIPVLNIARRPVPDNEAMRFLQSLGTGWNLGNTFDAYKQGWNANADEMTLETSWCGVKTSEAMIEALHQAGFSSIRIPVSWHDHVSGEDYQISERWMARVQQVVDWAIQRDMYVIVNTHHDVGAQYYYPDPAHYDQSARYLGSVWRQIAQRFQSYDEHLILESMNEPRLTDTDYEWNFNPAVPQCRQSAECIQQLNQLFVDTVRATGGNNADRYLMVPAYDASPQNATGMYFALPQDTADNRIIVSVHAYTPYSFALQDGGVRTFTGTSPQQNTEIVTFMNSLYNRYITQGIPVVIGEFGARSKSGNLQDRVNFAAFYTATASARNLPCLWWDNGAFTGNGELFGLLRRSDATWTYPQIVQAMMRYSVWQSLPDPQ